MTDRPGAELDEEDPLVEACVRDALAPFRDVLSPEELAEHRIDLIAFITTHPRASHLYQRLRKRRAVVAASYEEPRDDADRDRSSSRDRDGTSGAS